MRLAGLWAANVHRKCRRMQKRTDSVSGVRPPIPAHSSPFRSIPACPGIRKMYGRKRAVVNQRICFSPLASQGNLIYGESRGRMDGCLAKWPPPCWCLKFSEITPKILREVEIVYILRTKPKSHLLCLLKVPLRHVQARKSLLLTMLLVGEP